MGVKVNYWGDYYYSLSVSAVLMEYIKWYFIMCGVLMGIAGVLLWIYKK